MIAAILAAFAVGTFWFWALVMLGFIVITAFVENDSGFWATVAVIITVGALDLLCRLPVIPFLFGNPKRTVVLVGLYFVAGAIWGSVKFLLYAHRQLELYNEAKAAILRRNKATELTPKLALALKDSLGGSYQRTIEINPQVANHKSDILFWMTYWPFSAFWTIINDPIRRAFRFIYGRLQGLLQAASDRMFAKANSDLDLAQAEQDRLEAERAAKHD